MSQDNVEIVKAAFEAWNGRDWDAAVKDSAPGAEFDVSRAYGPYRGVYRLDQWRQLIEDFSRTFESARIEAREFIDAGDHILVPVTTYTRGRDGIEATAGGSYLWTIHDGAVVRVCLYQEDQRHEAVEAAGLPE
jgi:ketosteroid isomerase-like protein